MKYLAKHPEGIHEITSRQFEELIAEILAGYGWDVELTPATKDGGYDLYAISKDISGLRSHWIIECKKWAPDRKVGVEIVRALYGVKSDRKMGNALLATTSHFTHGVEAFKNSRYDLALKDYEGILQWINEYTPHPNGKLYIRDNRLVIPQSGRSS
jgi:restriction endonuclease Mrr